MAAIAGIFKTGQIELVSRMLETMSHRGEYGKEIIETNDATIGMIWTKHENARTKRLFEENIFRVGPGFGHHVKVSFDDNKLSIERGKVGVVPLYLAMNNDSEIMFASEVKALLPLSEKIVEFMPGQIIKDNKIGSYFNLVKGEPLDMNPEVIAKELLDLLMRAVDSRIQTKVVGAWRAGGLASSAMAALARPYVQKFYSFAGGVKGAPDLKFAREAAAYIGTEHHEVILDKEKMLKILPDVIYQLESFDALLVRSSIVNLSVAWAASDYITDVFSGEGGDELFAGYSYLKALPMTELDSELLDIISRLHNTALQRVDRSASAFGLTAHVVFVDPEVVDYALRIPAEYKIRNGVEKWILRKSMAGLLPESILNRPKAKFWQGAGVESIISEHAEKVILDSSFLRERELPNGWKLNTKEELYYYRIFKEYFGEPEILDWMGRTKGSPVDKNHGIH